MTNISKQAMSAQELEQLFKQLNNAIGNLDKSSANSFLHDLLGPEERIMLAKRFAMIIMLTEQYSGYQIAQKLKVSTSTVKSTQLKLQAGTYDQLLLLLRKNKRILLEIWQTLDSILHLGGALPHYNGLDRYKAL